MRNLKRALSLLLSSTMVLGMLVMGGSAAGYKDVDASNDHQEAIEVLQAVGIMTGDENGNFNPDGSITRNEMAVIMAHLLNLDYDYYRGTNPFTDVPEWAAPYVAACAAEGVVAGIGNGQYGGDQKVTAAQASLMIMKALGYFQNAEDFGTDWQVATIRQASYINLFDQIDASAESALTRAQVAQLVLNGLQSDLVYFTGDKGIQIGDVTVGYKAEYTSKTSSDKKYNTLVSGKTDIANQGQYYVQLGEELYDGQLRKAADADEFDRPAFTWSYKAQKIGTYVDWSLLVKEYTTAVTGEDLYNVLTASAIKKYDFAYYVDGKATDDVIKASNMIRTNTKEYTTTGNGVLTQVFVDNVDEKITITTINTYLAKATADYNDKKGTLSVEVYNVADGTPKTIDVVDVPGIEGVKEDDYLLVNWAELTNNTNPYEVVTVATPEIQNNVSLTKFSIDSYVVADGTQYDYAKNGSIYNADPLKNYGDKVALTNYTYNLFFDQYGYLIGTSEYSGEKNYVFITGYDLATSHLAIKTAEAGAIFLDGTMKVIDVNVNDTNDKIGTTTGYPQLEGGLENYNKWFTYSVNSDGVYTLTPVDNWLYIDKATADDKNINCSSARLSGTSGDNQWDNGKNLAYGNDNSVYLTVETGKVSASTVKTGITKVTGTYTGVQDVDLKVIDEADNALANSVFAVYDEDLYIIGAVVIGEDANSTENYAYAVKSAQNEWIDEDDNYYWDFKAIVDGEYVTLTVKEDYSDTIKDGVSQKIEDQMALSDRSLFKLTYDKDGYVIDATLVTNDTTKVDDAYTDYEFGQQKDITDDFKVYDLEHRTAGYRATLKAIGRTLYVSNKTTNDVGLTVAADAPIFVIQKHADGSLLVDEYTTLSQALNSLEDAEPKTDGLQLDGFISAVLNPNGSAKYLVIKSTTSVDAELDDGTTPSDGELVLNSLVFDATKGMAVNITNKTGSALTDASKVSVVVKNSDGNQVYAGVATAVANGNIVNNNSGNIRFGNFKAAPSNTGNYTVTLTVTVGGETYTSTAVLGTV